MSDKTELDGGLADRLLKKRVKTPVESAGEVSGEKGDDDSRNEPQPKRKQQTPPPPHENAEPEKNAASSGNTERSANKPPKKDEKKEKFYTYMSAENYEEFEEMFAFVRKAIARSTGKKLKVTNMAELAIILAKKQLFDQDKKSFIEMVERELD